MRIGQGLAEAITTYSRLMAFQDGTVARCQECGERVDSYSIKYELPSGRMWWLEVWGFSTCSHVVTPPTFELTPFA